MNEVRERVLLSVSDSIKNFPHSEHRELMNISVCSGYFGDCEDDENGIEEDFNEVVAIVDAQWLYGYMMQTDGDLKSVDDCRKYLREVYTSDDSIDWFDEANRQKKIMMIAFN